MNWLRVCAGAAALQVAWPMPLAAIGAPHLALKRSDPVTDSRLATAPRRISLWFTAKPELAFSRISLAGPAGPVALAAVTSDTGFALHAAIPRLLEPGSYTVSWQTGSADGHPIKGEIVFVVLASGATVTADTGAAAPASATPASEVVSPPRWTALVRLLEFAAVICVLGVLGFRHGVLPPLAVRGVPTADAADTARRLGLLLLGVYAVAAATRLYFQSVELNGVGIGSVVATGWGAGWSAGVLGALLLTLGWVISPKSVAIGTPLALTGALGMALSPALSGHAASSTNFVTEVTLDTLHVATAGVWIGGLAVVLIAGIPAMLRLTDGNRFAAVSALVNSFHPLALFCAPLAVATGLATAWFRVGVSPANWTTSYGRTLLLKIACVALVLGMGAWNSLRVRRRLAAHDADATTRFRRTGAVELLLAVLVLAVTTALVATPTPLD